MPTPRATEHANRLLASYPGRQIGLTNIEVIAEALDEIGLDIAEEVVRDLQQYCPDPPSVAQVRDVADDVRKSRQARQVPDWMHRELSERSGGRDMTTDELSHGIYHLRRSMDGRGEWAQAKRPWDCDCSGRSEFEESA